MQRSKVKTRCHRGTAGIGYSAVERLVAEGATVLIAASEDSSFLAGSELLVDRGTAPSEQVQAIVPRPDPTERWTVPRTGPSAAVPIW
jgi:NAD(P)-dependent dehydrogenase (short-subunit alcohol dehydrogenase family)